MHCIFLDVVAVQECAVVVEPLAPDFLDGLIPEDGNEGMHFFPFLFALLLHICFLKLICRL